ncbi:hypothetical protein Droror1_Dr00013838 [Drosera rotundifolia]
MEHEHRRFYTPQSSFSHQDFAQNDDYYLPRPVRPISIDDMSFSEEEHDHESPKKGHGIPMEVLEELDHEGRRLLRKLLLKLEMMVPAETSSGNDEPRRSTREGVMEWLDKVLRRARGHHSTDDGVDVVQRGLDPGEEALVSRLEKMKG